MSETWKIFQGNRTPHDGIEKLPPPPPWRSFSKKQDTSLTELKGSTFVVWKRQVELVNAALYLRRPLW